MKYPFYFKVKLFFEGESEPYALQSGIGAAESYAKAAKQIEEYFFDSLETIEHLEFGGDTGSLFLMPDKVCQDFIHNDSFGDYIKCNKEGKVLNTID